MSRPLPPFDPGKPREAIAAAAARVSNWGRWGEDDVLGTVNFIDADARVRAAALVRRGTTFSLSIEFGADGPQTGAGGRINPLYAVRALDTADAGDDVPFPPHGFGGVDDMVVMPLQCATQWDSLGHVFDRGHAWNGRNAADVASVQGDRVTGVQTLAAPLVTRGVLLDVGRALGTDGELPDGFAITVDHLEETSARQGATSAVGRGDILLVRTGRMTKARREGWGTYAGGPAPGLSFTTADWLHDTEIAAVATDTWGCEVRPNEFDRSFQPLHQVVIPHIGMPIGEIWDLDALAADCADDGVYEFLLAAGPIPFTGAAGAPVNPLAVK
ncbi:cyclase family protein [Streptomyces spongiae]|uniref:Cyclase family protein n=1 Tax=Streptomyces spongiae TaxID=565072 RepID=A0A5N8XFM1_9ACTN|nr:cyclase family protein [Streptomyces spongiae]MPY58239.1 cyclase family protein [Streptomyces spongiae]